MLFAALLLAATPQAVLKPTGPWYIRQEDDMCLLQQTYRAGNEDLALIFQPLLDLPTMEVFVVGPDPSSKQYVGGYTAEVEPRSRRYAGHYYSVQEAKGLKRITRLTMDRTALEELTEADVLHLQAKPIDFSFVIPRPEKARLALRSCIADLEKSWGFDPAITGETVSPLKGDPALFFKSTNYPEEALRKGMSGRVIAFLTINAAGIVTNCRIVASAGEALNAGTCKQAMSIRFKPPRDKEGKALPSTALVPVRWVLPDLAD